AAEAEPPGRVGKGTRPGGRTPSPPWSGGARQGTEPARRRGRVAAGERGCGRAGEGLPQAQGRSRASGRGGAGEGIGPAQEGRIPAAQSGSPEEGTRRRGGEAGRRSPEDAAGGPRRRGTAPRGENPGPGAAEADAADGPRG